MKTFDNFMEEDLLNETLFMYEEYFESVDALLDELFDEDNDELELSEIVKRVKIDPKIRRERAKKYRLNKHKIKRARDKYKKTASFKKQQKKYKRKSSKAGYIKKKFI